MIQLTKGTNVLDINLSDFSGAGQDVVQNGSFTDIGSDLVQNGDFAEIGSELVTNGDFSDVPLSGELILDGDFPLPNVNWIDYSATINGGSASITGLGNLYTTGGNWSVSQSISGYAVDKKYKVTFTAKQLTGIGAMFGGIGYKNTFSQVVTSEYVTYTFYQTALIEGANRDRVAFGGVLALGAEVTNTFEIKDVSVKEVINLVSNPNFTDGVEKIVDGDFPFPNTAWTLNTGVTVPSAGILDFDGTSGAYAHQDILTAGNSYKVTIEVADASLTDALSIFLGAANNIYGSVVAADTTIVLYGVAGGVDNQFYVGSWEGTITNVSVKELGADWDVTMSDGSAPTATKYVEFVETGARFVSDVTAAPYLYLDQYPLSSGKLYKFTCNVAYTDVGSIKVSVGASGFITLIEGVNTIYSSSPTTSTLLRFIRASDDVDCIISNISVQELGEGWTLGTGWSIGEDKAVCDGSQTTYSGLIQNSVFTSTKSYKLTFDITSNQENFAFWVNGSQIIFTAALSDGSKEYYFTASASGSAYFEATTSFIGTITNITVKEVGQDWTVTNSDSTHYVEFFGGVGGARFVADTVDPIMTLTSQSPALLLGKSYKLIVDVTVVSGSVKFDSGGVQEIFDATTSGTNNTRYIKPTSNVSFSLYRNSSNVDVTINSVIIQQLDTNDRWVTFADPDSLAVMKLGQVDLEIDSSGNNCGVYQAGLIKPNKLYIITINMKATAALNVEIAASLGTAVSAVIGTTALTTSYVEYSFEYVTPFAVAHDLQIHRLFGTGADQTISIDYVSMNGVDESQWINDPTWNPFATSLVFVPTLTDESTNNSKQFTLNTSIADGGWNGRSLHGQVNINQFPTEAPELGIINLEQPNFLEGFYQVEIRGYLGTFYRILGKGMAHLERASTEDGYNRFEAYNDSVTYKAYEE
jgi:hypothetical protein